MTSDQPGAGTPARDPDELLPEYDAALIRAGERGRYAARYTRGTNLVPLDPDVAAAFPDPAEVNAVLRAVAGLIRAHQPARGADRAGADAAAA
ncbi:MAG TPA: hypothetical protein VGD56_07045 [Gemmatirosa sp.]